MEEQKRRAEQDKLAAISALEERSREFMQEKKEKETLERRINGMQSKLLVGGQKLEELPAIRDLLEREQRRIRGGLVAESVIHWGVYLIVPAIAPASSAFIKCGPCVHCYFNHTCHRGVYGKI